MIRELKGWHVLAMLLAFFGVTIGVNTVFVTYALSTFSGEDVDQPYMKGLVWNKTIASRVAQAKLGWSATLSASRLADRKVAIALDVVDREHNPVADLDVSVTLRSPVNAHFDRQLKLASLGSGRYAVAAADVQAGQWDVVALAGPHNTQTFEAHRRIVVP